MRKWALAVVMSVNTLRDTWNEGETETMLCMFSGVYYYFRTGDIIFLCMYSIWYVRVPVVICCKCCKMPAV